MKTSETTKHIAAAVGALQQRIPYLGKDSKNYQNRYTSLPAFNEKVYPHMRELGLSMTQFLDNINGEPALTSRLMFAEHDEWYEATFPISRAGMAKVNDAQDWGGGISYFCRYGKHAITGIASDDDDAIGLSRPGEGVPTEDELGPNPGPLPKRHDHNGDFKLMSRKDMAKWVEPWKDKMTDGEKTEFKKFYADADQNGLAACCINISNRLAREGG